MHIKPLWWHRTRQNQNLILCEQYFEPIAPNEVPQVSLARTLTITSCVPLPQSLSVCTCTGYQERSGFLAREGQRVLWLAENSPAAPDCICCIPRKTEQKHCQPICFANLEQESASVSLSEWVGLWLADNVDYKSESDCASFGCFHSRSRKINCIYNSVMPFPPIQQHTGTIRLPWKLV